VARAMASVIRSLADGGKFYVTWPESAASNFEPITWPDGGVTYSDREPYHYSFDMLAALTEVVGGRAERVDDQSHPRQESVLVIYK
jgi:hypothetical protein